MQYSSTFRFYLILGFFLELQFGENFFEEKKWQKLIIIWRLMYVSLSNLPDFLKYSFNYFLLPRYSRLEQTSNVGSPTPLFSWFYLCNSTHLVERVLWRTVGCGSVTGSSTHESISLAYIAISLYKGNWWIDLFEIRTGVFRIASFPLQYFILLYRIIFIVI